MRRWMLVLLSLPMVLATGESSNLSVTFIGAAGLLALLGVILSFILKPKKDLDKWVLFLLISVPVVVATVFVSGYTIYENAASITKGPVHWHTDYEIWDCGTAVKLIEPTGLTNRIGTTVFHDHNDNRMHIEGRVFDNKEVSLPYFFEVIGGSLDGSQFQIPTDSGFFTSSATCDGQPAEVQVFRYRIVNPDDRDNWEYEQTKITIDEYFPAPYSNVPPGDCVIIEAGPVTEKTEHICESYRVAQVRGDIRGR